MIDKVVVGCIAVAPAHLQPALCVSLKVPVEEDLTLFDGYKRQSHSWATEEQLPSSCRDDCSGLRRSWTELTRESCTLVGASVAPTIMVDGQHASDMLLPLQLLLRP